VREWRFEELCSCKSGGRGREERCSSTDRDSRAAWGNKSRGLAALSFEPEPADNGEVRREDGDDDSEVDDGVSVGSAGEGEEEMDSAGTDENLWVGSSALLLFGEGVVAVVSADCDALEELELELDDDDDELEF